MFEGFDLAIFGVKRQQILKIASASETSIWALNHCQATNDFLVK
jgi:hypothetical protein